MQVWGPLYDDTRDTDTQLRLRLGGLSPPPPRGIRGPKFQISKLCLALPNKLTLVILCTRVHFLGLRDVLKCLEIDDCVCPRLASFALALGYYNMVSRAPTWTAFYKNLSSSHDMDLKMDKIMEFNIASTSENVWISNLIKKPWTCPPSRGWFRQISTVT